MDAPREVREWFTLQQPIKRDTVFQICFAFGLDGGETDEFFRRIFTRERSFNCHQVQEAVYYFCLNNGLSHAEALDIQTRVPLTKESKKSSDVVYTGSIIAELNDLESKEELLLDPRKGAAVETFAVAELLKGRMNTGRKPNLTYFRDKNGLEVDTIADWKHTFAIEIKSNSDAEAKLSSHTRRYLELREDPGVKGAIFYLGDVSLTINGIEYVRWQDWGKFAATHERRD